MAHPSKLILLRVSPCPTLSLFRHVGSHRFAPASACEWPNNGRFRIGAAYVSLARSGVFIIEDRNYRRTRRGQIDRLPRANRTCAAGRARRGAQPRPPGQIKVADERLDFLERTYGFKKRVEVELTVLDFEHRSGWPCSSTTMSTSTVASRIRFRAASADSPA